jgi:hypothetical protein
LLHFQDSLAREFVSDLFAAQLAGYEFKTRFIHNAMDGKYPIYMLFFIINYELPLQTPDLLLQQQMTSMDSSSSKAISDENYFDVSEVPSLSPLYSLLYSRVFHLDYRQQSVIP